MSRTYLGFAWCQWTPDSSCHNVHDARAKRFDQDLRLAKEPAKRFLELWAEWNRDFPGHLLLATLTTSDKESWMAPRGVYQLRFWFGEPDSFRSHYVDSMGHNLICHVSGEFALLELLVQSLVPKSFTRNTENGVIVWRRTE